MICVSEITSTMENETTRNVMISRTNTIRCPVSPLSVMKLTSDVVRKSQSEDDVRAGRSVKTVGREEGVGAKSRDDVDYHVKQRLGPPTHVKHGQMFQIDLCTA